MSNNPIKCPKCKSDKIHAGNKGFSTGQAVAGAILKTKNTEGRQKSTTKLRELISLAIASLKNITPIVDSIREYRTKLNETLK